MPDADYRATVLLKAAYTLLRRLSDSSIVLNLLDELVEYDGAECDGLCLMEDIESVLLEKGAING